MAALTSPRFVRRIKFIGHYCLKIRRFAMRDKKLQLPASAYLEILYIDFIK